MAESTKKDTVLQMIKFTLFSISAGVIQIASFTLLHDIFGWAQWLSHFVALVLSVLWNFTFNRRYTFRSSDNVKRAMLLVALFYVVFTPVSTLIINALVQQYSWNGTLAQLCMMLLNFVTEFIYQRFVVFRDSIDTNDVAARAKAKKENK